MHDIEFNDVVSTYLIDVNDNSLCDKSVLRTLDSILLEKNAAYGGTV